MTLHDSLVKLKQLGINIAEPVLNIEKTETPEVRELLEQVFSATMAAFKSRDLKGVIRTQNRHENFTPLSVEELEAFFQDKKFSEDFVLFKYPKNSELLLHGYCIPNAYFNVYQFSNTSGNFRVLWGSDVDERGFLNNAPGYRKTIDKINSILVNRVRGNLEDCEIEFAIFDKPAGVNGEPVTFWGYRSLAG